VVRTEQEFPPVVAATVLRCTPIFHKRNDMACPAADRLSKEMSYMSHAMAYRTAARLNNSDSVFRHYNVKEVTTELAVILVANEDGELIGYLRR
jgi:hypothetical protein